MDGKLKVNPAKVESDDQRTMEINKQAANDIDDMITMTVDVPSQHPDKKLPVLDLKVWLEENLL